MISTQDMPRFFRVLLGPAFVALASACSSGPPVDPKSYVDEIATARTAKDNDFRTASNSPVPENRRAALLPLAYFPIDPEYKAGAVLKPSNDTTVIDMPTSTGGQAKMRRVGTLEFSIKGHALTLTAFREVGATTDRLFVPFTDLTTGTETYAAGRFLELDPQTTGIYEIDFNRAFIPYCYYSPTYECPYPPAENRLQIPVRAGERLRKEAGKS
jgi:uncharacterized protein (DUF1684 family)